MVSYPLSAGMSRRKNDFSDTQGTTEVFCRQLRLPVRILIMRIGITGATGFIGTALTKAALERGHEVVAFSRNGNLSLPGVASVRPIHLDQDPVLDPGGLDALVHLAGESVIGYWTTGKKARIRDSRVNLTQRIVAAMAASPNRPKTFICASGTGAYGNGGDSVLTESSPRGIGFLASVCKEWEECALRAADLGLRVVLLRTGMVLGDGGGSWPLLKKIFKLGLGSRLGDGRQYVPWIHLDDEVGIILHALEQEAYQGPVNVTAPHPVTNAEMTRLFASQLKRPTFIPAPAFALRMILGDLATIVLDSQRVIPKAAQDNGYHFKHPTLEEALVSLL